MSTGIWRSHLGGVTGHWVELKIKDLPIHQSAFFFFLFSLEDSNNLTNSKGMVKITCKLRAHFIISECTKQIFKWQGWKRKLQCQRQFLSPHVTTLLWHLMPMTGVFRACIGFSFIAKPFVRLAFLFLKCVLAIS